MSVRLGIFLHHLEELFKQVIRVVRAGRRLGMILHAESRQRTMRHAFDRLVVQIDVRDVDVVEIQAVGIHREAVILRRDLDLVALEYRAPADCRRDGRTSA